MKRSPALAPVTTIEDEKLKLEENWNSKLYEFLSWDQVLRKEKIVVLLIFCVQTMKISSRDPPLIQTVKGFPLECGNEGVDVGGLIKRFLYQMISFSSIFC